MKVKLKDLSLDLNLLGNFLLEAEYVKLCILILKLHSIYFKHFLCNHKEMINIYLRLLKIVNIK